MASSHDIPVIPHGSSVYSYHLQYAFANCPLAEYINLSPKVSIKLDYTGALVDLQMKQKNAWEFTGNLTMLFTT